MGAFASQSQARLFFAKQGRGELPQGEAEKRAHETPGGIKSLPESVGSGKKGAGPVGGCAGAHGPHERVPFNLK